MKQATQPLAPPLWHSPSEEMPGDREIVAVHGGTLSLGYAHQFQSLVGLMGTLSAWCYTQDLIAHSRVEDAALRARCERLEGALRLTIDRCARVELGAPSHCLANDLANVLRAALAQLEDGK